MKSTTVKQVYGNLIFSFLEKENSLDTFSLGEGRDEAFPESDIPKYIIHDLRFRFGSKVELSEIRSPSLTLR